MWHPKSVCSGPAELHLRRLHRAGTANSQCQISADWTPCSTPTIQSAHHRLRSGSKRICRYPGRHTFPPNWLERRSIRSIVARRCREKCNCPELTACSRCRHFPWASFGCSRQRIRETRLSRIIGRNPKAQPSSLPRAGLKQVPRTPMPPAMRLSCVLKRSLETFLAPQVPCATRTSRVSSRPFGRVKACYRGYFSHKLHDCDNRTRPTIGRRANPCVIPILRYCQSGALGGNGECRPENILIEIVLRFALHFVELLSRQANRIAWDFRPGRRIRLTEQFLTVFVHQF